MLAVTDTAVCVAGNIISLVGTQVEGSAPQLLTSLLSKGYFTYFVGSGVPSDGGK